MKMKLCLLVLLVTAIFHAGAQRNPGYIGRKNVVNAEINITPFGNSANQLYFNGQCGIERSLGRRFAVALSAKMISYEFSQNYFAENYSDFEYRYEKGSNEYVSIAGSCKYLVGDISVVFKQYINSIGGLAPRGVYWKFGAGVYRGKLRKDNTQGYRIGNSTITYVPSTASGNNVISGFEGILGLGKRKMISNRIGYFADMEVRLYSYDTVNDVFYNRYDYLNAEANAAYLNNSVLQLNLGLSYVF